jgi:hypothetical protein
MKMPNSPGHGDSRFRAETPVHLLRTQAPAVQIFLDHFANIALRALNHTVGHSDKPLELQRPDNVFCIDGGRGGGKTYTLLSIEKALEDLSGLRRHLPSLWESFFLESLGGRLPKLLTIGTPGQGLVHILRIIFPGDLEREESLMEAIFAAMMDKIGSDPVRSKEEITKLQEDLRCNVAEGWYFAKRFGHEAIIRDSIDYADFVQRYEKEARQAANRITGWRQFIDRYLAFHNAAVLVVMVDDSDVRPELAQDILHSIRMFLNHPRVCTALAGNIRAMRNTLLHLSMQRIGVSVRAFEKGNQTAQDWRRTERRLVEDYLEKVIPPTQRFFLKSPKLAEQSDFFKITGREFTDIIKERVAATRVEFLRAKFALALQRETREQDRPSEEQRRETEEFLSWWVFADRYAASLAPRSARQIAGFGYYYATPKRKPKRLAVMLHDVPDNFTLVQRLGDEDVNVGSWLRQQELKSVWVGQRKFIINSRDVHHGSYTYEYIGYRLDLGLALPLRDNVEEALPLGLLPEVHGRSSIRRFFQPRNMAKQQRRYGVSRRIDHSAIPGNCVYFSDLSALPDLSLVSLEDEQWMSADKPGQWEASLAGRWIEVIEEEQDPLLVRYFTDVVYQALRDTDKITTASLAQELDPSAVDVKAAFGLYESSLRAEIRLFNRSNDLFGQGWLVEGEKGTDNEVNWWSRLAQTKAQWGKDDQPADTTAALLRRLIALYAALVSDLRRAWHAVRIHEHSPGWRQTEQAVGTSYEYERASRAWIGSQSRMPLYSAEKIAAVFHKATWISTLLNLFQVDRLEQAAAESVRRAAISDAEHARIDLTNALLRPFDCKTLIDNTTNREEDADYDEWIRTLRIIGRSFGREWPVYGRKDKYLQDIELEATLPAQDPGWTLNIALRASLDVQQQRGREARNFIFLLTGLAPCLPAIIHSNVMAEVYEAEMILSTAQLIYTKGAQQPDLQQPDLRARRERVDNQFGAALKHIETWAQLIGQLTISIRYINIKCRHLFAKLFINAVNDAIQPYERETGKAAVPHASIVPKEPSEAERSISMTSAIELLRSCELTVDDEADARKGFARLQQLFGVEAASHLAIMPDVAPATLFGEHWIADLINADVVRDALVDCGLKSLRGGDPRPEPADEAKNVKGMFGETEQWLWAANRCLRKLHAIVSDRRVFVVHALDSATSAQGPATP